MSVGSHWGKVREWGARGLFEPRDKQKTQASAFRGSAECAQHYLAPVVVGSKVLSATQPRRR